jgi:hypothetical protein
VLPAIQAEAAAKLDAILTVRASDRASPDASVNVIRGFAEEEVSLNVTSWNRLAGWLRSVDSLRQVA